MSKVILCNQVKCLICEDTPYSASVHDFKSCNCGNVYVDGGMNYLRRLSENASLFEEISISMEEGTLQKLKDALQWAEDTGRNHLGVICAIMRILRDEGYEVNLREEE